MRLVNDDQLWAGAEELVATTLSFDVVGRDDGVRVSLEEGLVLAARPLEARSGPREHELRVDVELLGQRLLPLLRKVWWTENGKAPHLTPVDELASDETRLDRLPDPNIVGDEHADRVELEGHEQRHELVGAWLNGDSSEGAEGAGAGAEAQAHSVPQQTARELVTHVHRGVGKIEPCGPHVLQRQVDPGDLVFGPTEGT